MMLAAAESGPYTLLVAFDRGGMTRVDYPSAASCERAKAAIDEDTRLRIRESEANVAPGTIMTAGPFHFTGTCIPR